MKKLLGIMVLGLLICNVGFAEVRLIEKTKVDDHRIYTWCVDGYKFVVFDLKHREANSAVQFFEQVRGVPGTASQPAKC